MRIVIQSKKTVSFVRQIRFAKYFYSLLNQNDPIRRDTSYDISRDTIVVILWFLGDAKR